MRQSSPTRLERRLTFRTVAVPRAGPGGPDRQGARLHLRRMPAAPRRLASRNRFHLGHLPPRMRGHHERAASHEPRQRRPSQTSHPVGAHELLLDGYDLHDHHPGHDDHVQEPGDGRRGRGLLGERARFPLRDQVPLGAAARDVRDEEDLRRDLAVRNRRYLRGDRHRAEAARVRPDHARAALRRGLPRRDGSRASAGASVPSSRPACSCGSLAPFTSAGWIGQTPGS